MKASAVQSSGGEIRLIPPDGIEADSWTRRLASFSELCEKRSAKADETSKLHPEVVHAFHDFGILAAPLPEYLGGVGLLDPKRWEQLHNAFRSIGAADLSVARLFEGHANAIDLVHRYGTPAQFASLASAVQSGAMTGVWGADGLGPLKIKPCKDGWLLEGGKILASGAGIVNRPLVTAGCEGGQQLVLLDFQGGKRVDLSRWTPQGMRSSATGSVELSGLVVTERNLIGRPGDFMRQPFFSAGAWRFCAVHQGAVERLAELYMAQLLARQRGDDPYQLQRVATCVSAAGTIAFWTKAAARQLALKSRETDACVALSNLTRGITERAASEVMDCVQRGTGLTSFIRPDPIERIARDLRTYLRQPVPDLAMADAARFALASSGPVSELW